MECTQRLECTQDVYGTCSERICPEQIGFLGICGSKQPVKKGPNKIGRDPQTCDIVLNDNSISRQHAVINILNQQDFMLMDLDSSNKTKLLGKILQPYIPHPLKNGDTVQFGQVFGIFRLLKEDDDLPMTQAVEIPDTPVNTRHLSRMKAAITTIPESPDVSDRDDSIIAQQQLKKNTDFKSLNNNLIKSPRKNIGIQIIGTNKIDNVYWNSSKKSDSFSSNFESNSSYAVNKSSVSPKTLFVENAIYDMETQQPAHVKINQTSESIHEANTQIVNNCESPTIYSCVTQVPTIEKLPGVFKVPDQSNVQLNLYSTNENFNIFEADTQVTLYDKKKLVTPIISNAIITNTEKKNAICTVNKKLNSSDEEICFDEIDCQQFEDECGSQTLLPSDPFDVDHLVTPVTNPETKKNIENNKVTITAVFNDSDSKDCEEIPPSQVVPEKPIDDEDVTDCEDNMLELTVNSAGRPNKIQSDDDATDCEDDSNNIKKNCKGKTLDDDDLTDCEDEIIQVSQNKSKADHATQNFEDLPTQIIGEDLTNLDIKEKCKSVKDNVPFEEMLTQVIEECPIESNVAHIGKDTDKPVPFEDLQTQVIDVVFPPEQSSSTLKQIGNKDSFKRPFPSPRITKKNATLSKSLKSIIEIKETSLPNKVEDDENYYDATQQIFNDLCTQTEIIGSLPGAKIDKSNLSTETNIEKRLSRDSDKTKKNNNIFLNLSKEQVKEVIGADSYTAPVIKKMSSDSSDLEVTPKKFNPSKFLMIDLPNSQEIKSCDFVSSKFDASDSSDGFEDTEDQDNNDDNSAVPFHRKRRKKDVKLDLMKKFDMNTLPTRAITRIRKPAAKILDSDSSTKKMSEKILQSKLGLDKEHEIDGEVFQLNLKRLRSKLEKSKHKTSTSTKNSNKDKIDTVSKDFKIKQSDKRESKEYNLVHNVEKVPKQNMNTKFKALNSKEIVEKCKVETTEQTDSSHKTRRSSRNKSTRDKKEITELGVGEVNSEYHEKTKSSSRKYCSRKHAKETIDLTKNEEVVIRRSKRHQSRKDQIEDKTEKSRKRKEPNNSEKLLMDTSERNNATSSNEYSTVYNLSSETAIDLPTSLKRQATSDIFSSKSKKAKSSNAVNSSGRATSSRGIRTQYVLFTAFPCEEVKLKLERLGAVIVSEVKSCTVVLTLQIRRTFKLLCALGLGKPIVGPNWVQACADSSMIVDPWLYLMKDEATEKRFGFNLRQSLTCKRNFLKGYNVFCTPNVTPNALEMKSIVECNGGTWKEGGKSWFCVSCPADKALWPGLRKRGATLVSTEFILGGVLQQRINLERDKIG